MAAILAGSMLCEHLGEVEAARGIESAVADVASKKLKSMAAGRMGHSTSEVGDIIAGKVA